MLDMLFSVWYCILGVVVALIWVMLFIIMFGIIIAVLSVVWLVTLACTPLGMFIFAIILIASILR